MNDTERNFANDERGAAKGDGQVTGKVDSVARRRALLKGMSSGAALAAAALPLQALATGRKHAFDQRDNWPRTKKQATISGCHSAIKSGDTTTAEAKGYHCSWFRNTSNWPKVNGEVAFKGASSWQVFNKYAKFKDVFGGGPDRTFEYICTNQTAADASNVEHALNWVTALLNANLPDNNFPYTPAEVCAFYSSSKRDAAAAFFLNFMQGRSRT